MQVNIIHVILGLSLYCNALFLYKLIRYRQVLNKSLDALQKLYFSTTSLSVAALEQEKASSSKH